MPVVIGVDSSTQSTKVEVRDLDSGKLLASGRAPHPATGVAPLSEAHPRDWLIAFKSALSQAGEPAAVAISVAGQQHGMVLLDETGEVIRPAKLWNDTESAPDSEWLISQRNATEWSSQVGSVPVASFTITKLAWVQRNEPMAWQRLANVVLPHDWLSAQLRESTELITDRGDASGTGYWSPKNNSYDFSALSLVDATRDWKHMVPRVASPLEKTGEWRGAIIGPGTGDNMAGALGIGLQPGDVAISLGTSGTVYAMSTKPTADASGSVAGFADATGAFLPLVCTLNATKVFDTIANLLDVSLEEFGRLALETPCGANGLTLLPYLDGERTPNLPDSRGVLMGLTTTHNQKDLARATIEGVICGLLDGVAALDRQRVDTSGRIFLIGGGSKSQAVRRILAELSGREIHTVTETETVALGAARQAAAVIQKKWPEWTAASQVTAEPTVSQDARDACRQRFSEVRKNSFGV